MIDLFVLWLYNTGKTAWEVFQCALMSLTKT